MTKQLNLCDPYHATAASYEVIEVSNAAVPAAKTLPGAQVSGWSHVDRTSDYLTAVQAARTHCLLYGKDVWVVDRNDGDYVVFRVAPAEYSAMALASRNDVRTAAKTA